jgi:Uma2 family endonuclease
MDAATAAPPVTPSPPPNDMGAARTAAAPGQQFVFWAVNWDFYERMLKLIGDRRVRTTYDRGSLELMAPSWSHEWWGHRLDRAVLALCEELGLDLQGGGSTTFRRQDLERGLEPDECYYIRHASLIRGPREIDLTTDPPPDLAIEVDITRSSLDRMGIYASLGVPEVWRCDGSTLQVFHLQVSGDRREYVRADRSLSFPTVPIDRLFGLLVATQNQNEIGLLRAVRAWVRANLPPPPPAAGGPPAPAL